MTNPYYNHTSFPTPNSPGSSAALRAELQLITDGFNLLPTLTGNAYKIAMVNATGTALVASSALQSLAITGSTIDGTPIGATTRAPGNFTDLSVNGTAGLGTSVTIGGGSINATPIGASTPSTGAFTSLSVSGAAGLGTSVTIGGGAINATPIGGTAPAAGAFTTLSASSGITGNLTGNVTGNVTGNAGTVTNGVYTTGTYADPSWITSLAGSKITGNISGNAANVTGTVAIANGGTGATTQSGARTALDVPSTTGSGASGTWGISITGNAVTVNNGVYTTGSYSNPAWITGLAGTKITGDIGGNAANVNGIVSVLNGGTGLSSNPANGQLAIGNGTGYSLSTLTAGTGIVITNSAGGITIAASGSGSGTVTSVSGSGGTTGLTLTGGPITVSGTLTLGGTLGVANGGTGLTAAPANGQLAIGNGTGYTLATLTAGAGVTITNSAGAITINATGTGIASVSATAPLSSSGGSNPTISLSGAVAVGNGGTGATDAANARTNLGLAIGTDIPSPTGGGASGNWGISISGNAANVTGTVAVANGGTGVTTATGTGSVVLSASPTITGPTVSSGNLAFSGTAQRITGDFSNATAANRLAFQTSTTNGNSFVGAIPNGTGSFGAYIAYNGSDPANASSLLQGITSTDARLVSTFAGTGTYLPMTFYTGGSERVRVDTSGNVGIGTTGGAYKLEVQGSVNTYFGQRLYNTNAGSSAVTYLQLGNDTNGATAQLGLNSSTNTTNFGGANALYLANGLSAPIAFATAGSERLRIDSSGNVLIGTATPSGTSRLYIDSTEARIQSRNSTSGANGYVGAVNPNEWRVWTTVATDLTLGTNATERMRIDSSGNVGIGTASPGAKLDVQGNVSGGGVNGRALNNDAGASSSAGFTVSTGGGVSAALFAFGTSAAYVGVSSSHPLAFQTNNTERMRISADGALGFSGANYGSAGQVLTSNGSASAPSWQNANGNPTQSVVTGASQTAAAGNHYVLTNASLSTLTLPASPAAGDIVWVTVGNGRTDNVVARNGQNIMGLAEDMTLNNQHATVQLRFANSTLGWRLL